MGICYKIILLDEIDWDYVGLSKEERLKEFAEKYGGYCEKIAEWYGAAVFDVDKKVPYTDERIKLLKEYSDKAYYIADVSMYKISEIPE